ncbi:nuclear transport factor 2 family protein [Massilia sp. METH4]|uniref:nuclear transport factor 2 family protein n=1 Tax=Massilia sp. METH4 TaxID=3123041 RepID=UPI0030D5E610
MTQTLQEQLISLEQNRCRCLMENDIDGLRNLLSKELVHVHTRANVHSLDEYLHFVREVTQVLDLSRGPLTVRELGDGAAIMLGRQTNRSRVRSSGSVVVTQAQVTQAWVREQDGAWRIAVFHGTALPAEQAK